MDQPSTEHLAAQLQRELSRALASEPSTIGPRGLDNYINWLSGAINRLSGGPYQEDVRAVYDEWVDSHPRCARRAMKSRVWAHG